jgi:L-alanine-DL-glutamate epimerase-like enolase superfamily enzyme
VGGKLIIKKIEVREFETETRDCATEPTNDGSIYSPGSVKTGSRIILRIFTDQGVTGEYMGGNSIEYAGFPKFVRPLIGANALQRELIYNDARVALRQWARMGMSQIDIALWDLAGKYYDAPVYELLGGWRMRLPAYASTQIGDFEPDGLNSPEAYADFAEQCYDLGFRAYKIHPWRAGASLDLHVRMVEEVGKRMAGRMKLMLDPSSVYETFADAIEVGRACDAWGYYWYEDPYKDTGISAFGHRKMRDLIKTPLLQTEHIRGLEGHMDFVLADGTDFVRIDQDYDGGVTGVMKIAHAAESVGLDVEPHGGGPVRRHCMAATRNCNYYELGLVHPKMDTFDPAPYASEYSDSLYSIGKDGCVPVPDGPGLGVEFDWDYIESKTTGVTVYD